MVWSRGVLWVSLCVGVLVAGCQAVPSAQNAQAASPAANVMPAAMGPGVDRIDFELPEAWGGEVRCTQANGCLLGAVEHERNTVVLHRLERSRVVRPLASHPVPYHPDSAAWMSDELLAAAVEDSGGVDIFRVVNDKLVKVITVPAGFGPRDVLVVRAEGGRYRLLATPYIGSKVAWLDWQEGGQESSFRSVEWCKAPWHPTKVSRLPQGGSGVAVACLDDKRVMAVSDADLLGKPRELARFSAVPRQVRPSPSGQWLYVALETGGRNARIDMGSGELQWVASSPRGSSSVAPFSDDLVAWGEDGRIVLQRLGARAEVLESRELSTSGFSTSIQLVDADQDGHLDAVVLNSSGKRADVIYGPLWEKATRRP